MSKIEQYCSECHEKDYCGRACHCLKDRATVTCAAPDCLTLIKYPVGTKHPVYCRKHMNELNLKREHSKTENIHSVWW